MSRLYDCIIIGGGPAGLAVATGLARLLHTAVLLDSGVYRNGEGGHIHNVIGFDHRDPAELRTQARADILSRYSTIDFRDTTVVRVRQTQAGRLEAMDQTGVVYVGRKLVLAVGVRDIMLDIAGYADCWAKGVFHCLFCQGLENRGAESCGLIAEGICAESLTALHTGRMALQFSPKLTIYTNGSRDTAQRLRAALDPNDHSTRIRFESRRIARLAMVSAQSSRITLTLDDGAQVREGFLVSPSTVEINGPFAAQLGLEVNPSGEIKTTPPFLETSVAGVFAAGDCATPLRAIPQASAMGGLVAVAVAHQVEEELLANIV